MPTVKDADKNAFIGKAEDMVNATVSTARNALGHAETPADSGKASNATAPRPASTQLYAVPESQVMKTNTKMPFRNETEMMKKLADALEEF